MAFDRRSILRAKPEGYVVRVIAGSDDGRARRYDVSVNWQADKRLVDGQWNAHELLDSVQIELSKVT